MAAFVLVLLLLPVRGVYVAAILKLHCAWSVLQLLRVCMPELTYCAWSVWVRFYVPAAIARA